METKVEKKMDDLSEIASPRDLTPPSPTPGAEDALSHAVDPSVSMDPLSGKQASDSASEQGMGDTIPPTSLDLEEVQDVSANAFKEAYDYYKKNAVGDPKTREQYLGQLRNELAEYKTGEDGTKSVTRGLLKNFTDQNYKNALAAGEGAVKAILKQLSSAKYPDFEAFKVAREKAAADVHAQLQNNVAYAELSERLLKGLEELSSKKGLEFGLSDTEKEKEQLLLQGSRKNIEQQKKSSELQEAVINTQQVQTNLDTERKLLAEQNERQAREWKSRLDLESQLRQEQIAADLKAGFEERAKVLRNELADTTNKSMQMMMQMQKDAMESQAKLAQFLIVNKNKQPPPPPVQARPQGLLTSILAPVTSLVGGILDLPGKLV